MWYAAQNYSRKMGDCPELVKRLPVSVIKGIPDKAGITEHD